MRCTRAHLSAFPLVLIEPDEDRAKLKAMDELQAQMEQMMAQQAQMGTPIELPSASDMIADEAREWESWLEDVIRNRVLCYGIDAEGVEPALRRSNLAAARDGNAVLKLTWAEETATPALQVVDIEDIVLIPATASSVDTAVAVCQELRLRLPELKAKEEQGVYSHVDDIQASQSAQRAEASAQQDRSEGIEPTEYAKNTAEHLLYECIWRWPDKDGVEQDVLFTVHYDARVLLQADVYAEIVSHGERWFFNEVLLPRPNRFYGDSIAGRQEMLNAEMNTIHNMRIDRGAVANNPPLIVRAYAEIVPSRLEFGPGRRWTLADPTNDVREFEMKGVDSSMFNEEQLVLQYAERVDGVSDFSQGVSPGGRERTLGEVQIVTSSGGVRFDEMVAASQEWWPRLCRQLVGLYMQFSPDEVPKMSGWTPRFIPQGAAQYQKQAVDQQMAIQVYDRMVNNPLVASDGRKLWALTRDFLQKFGAKDVSGIVGKEQDAQAAMAAMQQAQMAAQAQEQGGPAGPGGPVQGEPPSVGGAEGM